MIWRCLVEVVAVGVAMLSQVKLIVACTLYPCSSRSALNLLPDLFLNIGNGWYRRRAAIDAEQVRGIGHDVDMGIVEAGDNRFTFTVNEPTAPFEEGKIIVGSNPDNIPSPRRHQLRPGPAAVHGQHICVIEHEVCCFYAQILLLDS
jgi:hypothetical protein